jgi:hypothetical protein
MGMSARRPGDQLRAGSRTTAYTTRPPYTARRRPRATSPASPHSPPLLGRYKGHYVCQNFRGGGGGVATLARTPAGPPVDAPVRARRSMLSAGRRAPQSSCSLGRHWLLNSRDLFHAQGMHAAPLPSPQPPPLGRPRRSAPIAFAVKPAPYLAQRRHVRPPRCGQPRTCSPQPGGPAPRCGRPRLASVLADHARDLAWARDVACARLRQPVSNAVAGLRLPASPSRTRGSPLAPAPAGGP